MARTFSLYKKGTAKAIQTGKPSPIVITGLAAGAIVAKGDYQVTATDDGASESGKVDLPGFTVLPAEG